jgi:hypothetical protein
MGRPRRVKVQQDVNMADVEEQLLVQISMTSSRLHVRASRARGASTRDALTVVHPAR